MTVVVDDTFVLELYETDAPRQAEVAGWYLAADEDFVMTPLVVAEIDGAVRRRGGPAAVKVLTRDFDSGAWQVRWWADALGETLAIARRNPELGLAEASLVALAERLRTDRIATLDDRFRTLTRRRGKPFTLLPDNA